MVGRQYVCGAALRSATVWLSLRSVFFWRRLYWNHTCVGSTCGFLRHPQQAACAFCVPPCMSSAPCHCYRLLGAWHAGIALLGSAATLLLLRCRFAKVSGVMRVVLVSAHARPMQEVCCCLSGVHCSFTLFCGACLSLC